MPVLIDSLAPSVKSSQMRSKAVYALSGLMKHSAAAVKAFDASGGWKVLKAALEGEQYIFFHRISNLTFHLIFRFRHKRSSKDGLPAKHTSHAYHTHRIIPVPI